MNNYTINIPDDASRLDFDISYLVKTSADENVASTSVANTFINTENQDIIENYLASFIDVASRQKIIPNIIVNAQLSVIDNLANQFALNNNCRIIKLTKAANIDMLPSIMMLLSDKQVFQASSALSDLCNLISQNDDPIMTSAAGAVFKLSALITYRNCCLYLKNTKQIKHLNKCLSSINFDAVLDTAVYLKDHYPETLSKVEHANANVTDSEYAVNNLIMETADDLGCIANDDATLHVLFRSVIDELDDFNTDILANTLTQPITLANHAYKSCPLVLLVQNDNPDCEFDGYVKLLIKMLLTEHRQKTIMDSKIRPLKYFNTSFDLPNDLPDVPSKEFQFTLLGDFNKFKKQTAINTKNLNKINACLSNYGIGLLAEIKNRLK